MSKEKSKAMETDKDRVEIAIVDENVVRNKIYVIRGVKVMLDFDLAEIYGYATSAFNQQVNRNIERFDDDFRFQLTREEMEELSISQNVTSIQIKGIRGGRARAPYAFTESGIYMLMTVLKGDLATRQSKALIRAFRAMKDYIIENQDMIGRREYLQLSIQVSNNLKEMAEMRGELDELGDQMKTVMDKLSDVVTRSEISPFLLDLGKPVDKREYLLLNGQPAKADVVYMDIYARAVRSIHIVDDYINIKTLRLLQDARKDVDVTIFSDNAGKRLHASDYADFRTEFPGIEIAFKKTCGIMHDRFIVLDLGTETEHVYHCGTSSKDAGVDSVTAIVEMTEPIVKKSFGDLIRSMASNPDLELK